MTPDIDALLHWYETLSPDSLYRLGEFYDAHAFFKDPFNEVHGVPAIRQVFTHMFSSTEKPRFEILEKMVQGPAAFATWRFTFALKGRQYEVIGASHFRFNALGMVTSHRDYWDPAEELWQKLPLLGPVVGWLRARFSVRA